MQATITYLLTEQAQRAQMAATGQPVARKQSVTEDIPDELIASRLASIGSDGAVNFDLTNRIYIDKDGVPFSNLISEGIERSPDRGVYSRVSVAPEYEVLPGSGLDAINMRLSQVATKSAEAIARETQRAKEAAQLQTDMAREQAAKADKEAAAAAKEAAKRDYLASWIGENGTDSQKARQTDGVMCRDEAIKALVDFTFAPLDGASFPRHTRPALDCTSEYCCDECEISRSVTDGVDCLTDSEHAWLVRIKAAMPDAKEYALRTHHVIHRCDHGAGCVEASNRSVVVKMSVGPFILTREYAL